MKIYQSTRDIYKDHQKEGLKKKRTKNTQYAQEDPIQSIKSNNGNEPSLIYKPTQAKRLQRKESFNSWSTYIHWLIERLDVLTKCFLVWIFSIWQNIGDLQELLLIIFSFGVWLIFFLALSFM